MLSGRDVVCIMQTGTVCPVRLPDKNTVMYSECSQHDWKRSSKSAWLSGGQVRSGRRMLIAWTISQTPSLLGRTVEAPIRVCRPRPLHHAKCWRYGSIGVQVWRRARVRGGALVMADAFRDDDTQGERPRGALSTDSSATSATNQSTLQQVLQGLPRYVAYLTALEAICRHSGPEQSTPNEDVSKPLSLDAVLALLREMQADPMVEDLEEDQKVELISLLLDAIIRAPTIVLGGMRIRRLLDDRFGVGLAALMHQLWDLDAISAFGVDQERTLTTHPPPRVRFFDAESIRRLWCFHQDGVKAYSSLAPLPTNPREELTQASVGLAFLALSSMAILGEVIDPLIFHRHGSEETLILTLLFGSYALDRFIYLFQGRISDTVDKGIRRLVGGNEEREALCDAASFVIAYVLGISDFAFRPRARLCLEWLAKAHPSGQDFPQDNHDELLRLHEERIGLYTIWLFSRTAVERCVDKELIESETRQARIFVREALRQQIKRLNASSDEPLTPKREPAELPRVEWEDFTLRWAFIEAVSLVRANMSLIRRVAALMLDGRSVSDCVIEIERAWTNKKRGAGRTGPPQSSRHPMLFRPDTQRITSSGKLDPGVAEAITAFRDKPLPNFSSSDRTPSMTVSERSMAPRTASAGKKEDSAPKGDSIGVSDRARGDSNAPSLAEPEANTASPQASPTAATQTQMRRHHTNAADASMETSDASHGDSNDAANDPELRSPLDPMVKPSDSVEAQASVTPIAAEESSNANPPRHDEIEPSQAQTTRSTDSSDVIHSVSEGGVSNLQEIHLRPISHESLEERARISAADGSKAPGRKASLVSDKIMNAFLEQRAEALHESEQPSATAEPGDSEASTRVQNVFSIQASSRDDETDPKQQPTGGQAKHSSSEGKGSSSATSSASWAPARTQQTPSDRPDAANPSPVQAHVAPPNPKIDADVSSTHLEADANFPIRARVNSERIKPSPPTDNANQSSVRNKSKENTESVSPVQLEPQTGLYKATGAETKTSTTRKARQSASESERKPTRQRRGARKSSTTATSSSSSSSKTKKRAKPKRSSSGAESGL
jgi:hypothetical protein